MAEGGGTSTLLERAGGGGRLRADDRLDVIVREDRVDVEAAAEAIGLAAREMRHLGQVEHRRQLRQVLEDMQRRGAVQAVARLALGCASLGQRPEHDARRCARRIDLDARAAGLGERFGGLGERRQIVRRHHLAGGLVEEQRREGGDAGKAAAIERVERVGNGDDIARIEAAFMAAIEGVALRMDARQQVLRVAGGLRAGGGFFGLVSLKTVQ